MIRQNHPLPESQRDWKEVERLIADAVAADPKAAEPEVLRAYMLLEQGQKAKAIDALETARARLPKSVLLWTTQAEMLVLQKEFHKAQELLDQAQQQLGDGVDLRLARARLAMARGGPQVVPALNGLVQGIESFSREDRRKLLAAMALELGRQRDQAGATRAWSRLVEEEPESLEPRLQLLDLALEAGDGKQAEVQIRAIAKLDVSFAQFCRARYLAWQARGARDAAAKRKLLTEARELLTDLTARRPDWSRIPLALARLDEQEIEEVGPDEARKRAKLESAIASYRRSLELGLHDPAVVRHFVQLLFQVGRGSEALEIYSQIPGMVQLTGDQGRLASQIALDNRDYNQARDLARKSVAANPDDFQAWVWLATVQLRSLGPDDAEVVLRDAVEAGKTDPDRWITLVRFMVQIRQPEKAEKVVQEAKANIGKTPLAMAECCRMVGKAYEASAPDRARSWYGQAREWFAKAEEAQKDPKDLTVKRRLAEFFLQTNQAAAAEKPLKEIRARTADGKSPDLAAWARRGLARVYVAASPPRTADALALFPEADRQGGVSDPDDLRVLSLVHEAQGPPEGRRQAIGDLESLVGRESATPEERSRLAQLLDAAGQWPKARQQFRELILRTEGVRDTETLARRPLYLAFFVGALTRHHQPGDDSDLTEARQMVEKLRPILPDPMGLMILEAEIDKAANQIDKATARINEFAARPNLTPADRQRLASLAERVGLIAAAEAVYRRIAAEPPADPNQFLLAGFLARHRSVKDAIDLCETLWTDAAIREKVAGKCVEVLCDQDIPADKEQISRVIVWFERARAEKPQSMMYLVGLGNLDERLGDYGKAEKLYRTAINSNDREWKGIASNNLAWLIVLKNGRGSDEAIDLINNAIRLLGPNPEFLDTRGMVYLTAGQGQRAITDLEMALKSDHKAPRYFHLAQAYLKLNEKEKARKTLEDGKNRGLPSGLHALELATYKHLASELGMP